MCGVLYVPLLLPRSFVLFADAIQVAHGTDEDLTARNGWRCETIFFQPISRHQLKFRRGLEHKHLPIIGQKIEIAIGIEGRGPMMPAQPLRPDTIAAFGLDAPGLS